MKQLRKNINRFFLRNRDKGIPNLMLWIIGANVLVYLISLFRPELGYYLEFEAFHILHGQVWRLFTYPLTLIFYHGGPIYIFLGMYFYYWVGKAVENMWGRMKFQCFLLTGLLLTDLAAILLAVLVGISVSVLPIFLFASLFLVVATLIPEQRVLLFFIIPIKMRWMALVDIGITVLTIAGEYAQFSALQIGHPWTLLLLLATTPAMAFLNYFLYFGRGVLALFPSGRVKPRKQRTVEPPKAAPQPGPDWAKKYRNAEGERPYRHKCTVCGRTDTQCPGLEFRYCSKCAGYFCYCVDHINNHTHVQ